MNVLPRNFSETLERYCLGLAGSFLTCWKKFNVFSFIFMYLCGYLCMSAGIYEDLNRVSGPLNWSYKQCDVTNPRWVLKTQFSASPRSASALNCWIFSPASRFNENKSNRKTLECRRETWGEISDINLASDFTKSLVPKLFSKCWLILCLAGAIFFSNS